MTTQAEYIAQLIHKYLKEELTEAEALALRELEAQDSDIAQLIKSAKDKDWLASETKTYLSLKVPQFSENTLLSQTLAHEHSSGSGILRSSFYKKMYAAASILLVGAIALYLFYTQNQGRPFVEMDSEVLAGREAAVLTLPNGKTLYLDSTFSGVVPGVENAMADSEGDLVYKGQGKPEYHTLSTRNGMKYQVTLADGTVVYLNAGSSICYPSFFDGKERRIAVTGEVYLAVAKARSADGRRLPFVVDVAGKQVIEVLGTEFNISAYPGQDVKTTLIKGAVTLHAVQAQTKSNSPALHLSLQPGEQSVLAQGKLYKAKVDVQPFIGWKEGVFDFQNLPLPEVLAELERWYGIEAVYDDLPEKTLVGVIRRDVSLSTIIHMLQRETKLHFHLKEGRLYIEP